MSLPGILPSLGALSPSASGGVEISLSPGNQYSMAFSGSSWTFNAETATASVGSPSSYTWSLSGYPGTWSILAGAGTATVTCRVTGVALGDVARGVLSCAAVVSGTTYYGAANLSFESASRS